VFPLSGIRPRKRFGQHFLRDPGVPEAITRVISPGPGDHLVEIGPGTGVLTAALLGAKPASLTLIEIDRDLSAGLRAAFGAPGKDGGFQAPAGPGEGQGSELAGGAATRRLSEAGSAPVLSLIEGDACTVDYTALAAERGAALRVVGNLPYNVASLVLLHLVGHRAALRDQTFMLQKEVVDRIVAPVGSAAFGRLTVMLQSCYSAEWLFDVEPEAFHPPPQVRSSLLRLRNRSSDAPQRGGTSVGFRNCLEEVVRVGFAQRRKMLRGTLLRWLGAQGLDASTAIGLGFAPEARAQDIAVEQWCALAACLVQARASAQEPGAAREGG